MSIPGQLTPSHRLLLGPGPSDTHPRVISAMASPVLGHLDPQFLQYMAETQQMLREVYRTSNQLTFPVSATGMAGMETCLSNLVDAGDRVMLCVKGFFGQRMVEVASRLGAELTVLEQPWGEVFDMDRVREEIRKVRPHVVGVVHAETSTGAWQPIEEFGKICHEFDALSVVDTVTSLACVPLEVDAWELDAVYSCSQKGLSCPPGMSPVTFSERATEKVKNRKEPSRSWYFDVTTIMKYWGADRTYHHTAPITMVYALREGLRLVLEEGLEARWDRHIRNHQALKAGLLALGLNYSAQEGHQLPQLNAVYLPDGVDDLKGRQLLLRDFGIEVGGGLGAFKGKVWRIGLMGQNSRPDVVYVALSALEHCLRALGANVTPGAGVAAAEQAYAAEI